LLLFLYLYCIRKKKHLKFKKKEKFLKPTFN
jgi:hypothetical protein